MNENTPPAWGAPQLPPPPGQGWTLRRTLIAAGVAVGIAAAGGVAIYAASGSANTGAQGGPGLHIMPPGGGDGGPMMMFELPHGEFQTGEVTELNDKSITVESDDDFTRTYAIDEDTTQTEGIEKGDKVTVIATPDGDTPKAASISELGTTGGGPRGPQPPNN